MIQVGKTYPSVGGGKVKIAIKSKRDDGTVIFTGTNGVWYDRFGYTTRGSSLCLVVIEPLREEE